MEKETGKNISPEEMNSSQDNTPQPDNPSGAEEQKDPLQSKDNQKSDGKDTPEAAPSDGKKPAQIMAEMVTRAAFQKKSEDHQEEPAAEKETESPKPGSEKETESPKPGSEKENKDPVKEPQKQAAQKKKGKPTEEFYDFGEDNPADDEDEEGDGNETSGQKDQPGKKEEENLPEYDQYDREKLVKELEELVSLEDVLDHKQKVALIKVAYLKKTEEAKKEELKKLSDSAPKKEQSQSQEKKPEEKGIKELEEKGIKEEGIKEEKEKEEPQPGRVMLEERFRKAFDKYKEKRMRFLKEQEQQQQVNLLKKKEILEELRQLINSEETLKKTYDDFKALQGKWKEIGLVPKQEVNELWKNYHFLVEKFFDKVKINKELRDLDLRKNLEQKVDLCEKAEELILEKSVNKSFKQLQELHEKYRVTGPVPDEQKEEVWNRFKAATEKIHDRRRQHYQHKEEDQQKNLDAKTALCEKMEEVLKKECKTIKDWNNTTGEVRELMKVWRSIGFAPKQHNDLIWKRFKTAVDGYFEGKKEFFDALKEEQRENYNRKVNLCMEAESLQDSTEWKKTTSALINLQKEWKKMGPVSRKHSDKLWKRFRTANDAFFNRKEDHFKNMKDREKENLEKKMSLIQKIKTHPFGDDKNENLKTLKEIQRQWMDIGFVPISKKDEIQKQYQEAVDKRMDELSISRTEVNQDQYKNRVSKLKDTEGGDRQLRKERGILMKKINKLKEDVQLWENNTGFLANTKNADILKEEFQKKIHATRKEIALLEAQMKILDKE